MCKAVLPKLIWMLCVDTKRIILQVMVHHSSYATTRSNQITSKTNKRAPCNITDTIGVLSQFHIHFPYIDWSICTSGDKRIANTTLKYEYSYHHLLQQHAELHLHLKNDMDTMKEKNIPVYKQKSVGRTTLFHLK